MEIQLCSHHDPGTIMWGHTQGSKFYIGLYRNEFKNLPLVNYTVQQLLMFYM